MTEQSPVRVQHEPDRRLHALPALLEGFQRFLKVSSEMYFWPPNCYRHFSADMTGHGYVRRLRTSPNQFWRWTGSRGWLSWLSRQAGLLPRLKTPVECPHACEAAVQEYARQTGA